MLTTNERIERLEQDLEEAKRDIEVAAGLSIGLLRTALDQLVDERILPAATRTEIWGRIRADLKIIATRSVRVARGAEHAVPLFQTRDEREQSRRLWAERSRQDERVRKEILAVRTEKPGDDQ